jgi:prepilin-type processing-associated H-X9-DG protein
VADYLKGLAASLRTAVDENAPMPLTALEPALSRPMGVAVYAIVPPAPPGAGDQPGEAPPMPPMPGVVLAIDVGAEDSPAAAGVAAFRQHLARMATPEGTSSVRVGGLDVEKLQTGPFTTAFAEKGDLVIVVWSPYSTSVETLLAADRAKLAKDAGLAAARAKVGPRDLFCHLYYDHAKLMGIVRPMAPPHDLAQIEQVIQTLGLADVTSVSIAASARAPGVMTTLYVASKAPHKGVLGLIDPGPVPDTVLRMVPKESLAFSAHMLDGDKLVGLVDDLLKLGGVEPAPVGAPAPGAAPPGEGPDAGPGMGAEMGASAALAREIMSKPKGPGAVVVGDGGGLGIFAAFTDMVCIQEVQDFDGLMAALNKLCEMASAEMSTEWRQAKVTIKETTYMNHPFYYVDFEGVPSPITPAMARHDDYVIVGLSPLAVKNEVYFLASGGPSILDNPDFRALRAKVPSGGLVSYSDFKKTFTGLYGVGATLLTMIAPIAEAEGGVDLGEPWRLPPPRVMEKHLFGSITTVTADADGVRIITYSPIGVAAALGAPDVGTTGVMAAVLVPAVSRSRVQAREARCRRNLRKLALALILYADQKGAFPRDVCELVAENFVEGVGVFTCPEKGGPPPAEITNATIDYVHNWQVTRDPPAETPLVWDKQFNHGGRGRNVAFADGHVAWMTEPAFRAMLARLRMAEGALMAAAARAAKAP